MRRTGKVPKFLSHRLFPSARFSIWLDSKMRLHTDPMLILEYFLFRNGSEYAISNHYDRHCVWEEVLQNKRLNKYNHSAIDEQFNFYQSDGLTKFDPSDSNTLLPSYVPEGSFIVRAHTPMSNLFSCLWFNEVDRFTSRDQLSFAYTYLKLRRKNPDKPFFLNMFKDCERRALAKLFRHRTAESPPPPNSILWLEYKLSVNFLMKSKSPFWFGSCRGRWLKLIQNLMSLIWIDVYGVAAGPSCLPWSYNRLPYNQPNMFEQHSSQGLTSQHHDGIASFLSVQ